MIIKTHSNKNKKVRQTLLILTLSLLLLSCDGGILGTSDGSGSGLTTEAANEDLIEQPESNHAFENLQIGSTFQAPQLSLINLGSSSLNVVAGIESELPDEPLFTTPIAPNTLSGHRALPLDFSKLTITHGNDINAALWTLWPINLGSYSVTTLVAREIELRHAAVQWHIEPLPTQLTPEDDNVARVRLLLATPLDDDDNPAIMTLRPTDGSPSGSASELGSVSASTFGQNVEYHLVSPGEYELIDALNRFSAESISVNGGEFYTFIIHGSPASLLQVRDSQ